MFAMRLKWVVALALLCGIPALAGPILINNTGINGGVAITPGQVDPSWILVGGNYNPYVTTGSPSSLPFTSWLSDNATSQWISPQATYTANSSDGEGWNWVFQTTFDLTGVSFTSGSISGRWLADNQGIDIYFNGAILSLQTSLNDFTDWTAFNINSGFVSGVNTLDFIVHNEDAGNGGPAGLRVEFLQAYTSDVPEPATFGLLGAGLLALGWPAGRRHSESTRSHTATHSAIQ